MGLGDALKFTVGLDMRPAELALRDFQSRAQSITSGLAGIKAGIVGIGGAVAGSLLGKVAVDAVAAGEQMETFESRLTTLMGSSSAAKARLSELFDYAATTPFNLDQVVGAEVTLRGFGADAESLMGGLIDMAATTGGDLSQLAIDFGKAWSQGATGLESDYGKILRKQIELRTGMDATKMSLQEFRTAMQTELSEGMFKGGADRLSLTFRGMVSNLEDSWTGFARQVADAGLFDNVKGALAETFDMIGRNKEDTANWARVISGGLWDAIKGTVTGIAYTVDGVYALGSAFLTVKATAEDAGAGALRVWAEVADVAEAFYRSVGLDGAADAVGRVGIVARETADEFGVGADATRDLVASLGEGGTALQRVEQFFANAEARAKGFNKEVAGGSVREPGMAPGGEDKEAKKKREREEAARLKELEDAFKFADDMAELRLTETQQIEAEYQERLDLLKDYHKEGLISGKLYVDTLHNIEANRLAQLEALKEEQAEKDRQRNSSLANTVLSSTAGMLGSIEGMLDQSNAKQKKAAKALAISQIVISAAAAGMKAFQDYGWPYGLIPAAFIAGQAGLSIAEVSKAHQGRSFASLSSAAPDERDVRVLRTESMLNSQATRALGQQGVDALNSGRGLGPTEISLTVGRVTQKEIIRNEMRGNGLVKQHVARKVRDGERDVGFTGAMAFG